MYSWPNYHIPESRVRVPGAAFGPDFSLGDLINGTFCGTCTFVYLFFLFLFFFFFFRRFIHALLLFLTLLTCVSSRDERGEGKEKIIIIRIKGHKLVQTLCVCPRKWETDSRHGRQI